MGIEVGSSQLEYSLVALVIGLLTAIVPLAILAWLIVSVQGMKKSLRSIERKLDESGAANQAIAEDGAK